MSQIDNKFTALFLDTTTAPWTAISGLSATITIREVNAPYTVVVDNEAMTEMGGGHYIYTFSGMSNDKDYIYTCNPNSLLAFVESGVTDKRINNLDQNVSDIRSWGGFSINYQALNNHVTNKTRELRDYIDTKINELPQVDLSEIKEAIDNIEIPEVPEFTYEEKEAKKAIKMLTTVEKKLSSYIDSEMKEKEEIMAISKELNKLDMEDTMEEKRREIEHKNKMEKEMKEKEIEMKEEEEENKKIAELLNAEFDKLEEEDRIEKKKELESELKEKEMEVKEIQKELKSL